MNPPTTRASSGGANPGTLCAWVGFFRCVALFAVAASARGAAQPDDVRVTTLAPMPLVQQLNAVHAIDAQHAVAVGEFGTIVRTADGGATWTHADTRSETALKGIAFAAPIGVVVGTQGLILRTADGGVSWTPAKSETTEELRAAVFAPSGVTVVVGAAGTILRSTDGGNSWGAVASGTRDTLRAIGAADAKTLVAVGDGGTVLISPDTGLHWQARESGTSAALRGVHFIDAKRGVIVGGDDRKWVAAEVVLRTNDGGATWSPVANPAETRLYSVSGQGSVLVAVGEQATILRSGDAGATWKREALPGPSGTPGPPTVANVWLSSVSLAPDGTALVVGRGGAPLGLIFRSAVDDPAWKLIRREKLGVFQYNSIARTSAGALLVANGTGIGRSTDGGATFVPAKIVKGVGGILGHIVTVTASTAVAVGASGTLFRTTDAGLTWKKIPPFTKRNLTQIAFADSCMGVAVGAWSGDGPTIFRTTDGGENWSPIKRDDDTPLWGVALRGREFGLAVGRLGLMLATHDGGATWTRIGLGATRSNLRSVAFLSDRAAVAIGENGTIMRTVDGGATWSQRESGKTSTLTAVSFGDRLFGVAVGNSALLVTTDAGGTWRELPAGRNLALTSVLADREGALVIGAGGIVLRLDRGGGSP